MTQPRPAAETKALSSNRVEDAVAITLGRIPSGLFVVTWRAGDEDRSLLASWVMQGGFEPPTITIAVAAGRDLLTAIDGGAGFVVNVLGESQRSLLARFGRPAARGEDPFAGLDVDRAPDQAVVLRQSAGWIACRSLGHIGGTTTDHAIVLAEVIAAGAGPVEQPLVHLRKNGLRY